jgi:hypothetical protein
MEYGEYGEYGEDEVASPQLTTPIKSILKILIAHPDASAGFRLAAQDELARHTQQRWIGDLGTIPFMPKNGKILLPAAIAVGVIGLLTYFETRGRRKHGRR